MKERHMKHRKIFALFIGLLLLFSFAAYGASEKNDAAADTGTEAIPGGELSVADGQDYGQAGALVVFFSATGTTKGVAERIASLTGAETKEIIPAQPYSSEDLNYNDRMARSSVEQNDPDARPEIAEDISVTGYDVIYLGYPIWWGQAPRILSSFVETHDFTGITVIPFCTSGSSDIGESDDTLAVQAGSGNWMQGRRFPGSATDEELQAWINETGGSAMEKSLHLCINDVKVRVAWEENESVDALADLAATGPLNVQMSMYGGFEQVGSLGTELSRNDTQTTTEPGDIVLYSGNQIVVFYGSNSWTYTKLGKVMDKTEEEMTDLLGNGDVLVTISMGG